MPKRLLLEAGRSAFAALSFALLAATPAACGADATEASYYETREPSGSGTGKVYMGREIAGVMSHRRMHRLDRPSREEEERPDLVVDALPLDADDVVADIGAGIGYFSFRVAERVPEGKVLAVDIQPEMLDELNKRAGEREIANVETVLGAIEDPGLRGNSVDVAIIVDSYHEFSHPREMGQAIYRSLRPGGHLVIVEERAEDGSGYGRHEMTEAQVRKELDAVGFDWQRTEDFLPQQHFVVFRKPLAEEIYPGYSWQEIAKDVYLHTSKDPLAGPVDGNSVVIIGESSVVVVDTHIDPGAARAVAARIKELSDVPVTHVVNTHWHDDHTNGNHAFRQAFPDARFLAHSATLAKLREEWAPMEAQRKEAYASVTAEMVLQAAQAFDETEPDKAIAYRVYAGYVGALKDELDSLELVYPDTVFQERMVLGDERRPVVVEWLGPGNTDGDVVVWLPGDNLLITGDVLVAPIPFAFDSPMTGWAQTLPKLAAKNAATIVPGHGSVMYDNTHIGTLIRLLDATLSAVRDARERGIAYVDLATAIELPEFEAALAGNDPKRRHAWRSYFLEPGVKSAWAALGYPLPEEGAAAE